MWKKFKKPILALAPMEDVTDTVFRRVIARCARPDVFFTEFTNCEGLQSPGRDAATRRLQFSDTEHPIVAQIWGKKPEAFYKTAQELVAEGFDGIDINFGCPEKSVVKVGACAALIDNIPRAGEIITAVQEGIRATHRAVPVSVKTRIGFKRIQTEPWISFLLTQKLDALIIHGRTAKEMSDVPCHWDEIGKAVKLRNDMSSDTVILGNGDVKSYSDALYKVKEYGVDGVMIGRAVFQNPWVFEKIPEKHSLEEKLELLKYHIALFETTWGKPHFVKTSRGKQKKYDILKKFFKIYISGFDGASEVRAALMATKSTQEALVMIKSTYG